ncbi:hypothetical protein [Flammeovirga agarivorans]|uniref:VLRF1 domain-containing protein n=1 Tax=Flammeovirga agarivorans TaxID=2726742 RepID=A0A7X8SNR9_9BACT|nr:hypothetical protein [Flammeovirga agarivorans]NLR93596.1 hypothetical protein [Flammeovirga agarivorans]
MISRTIPVKKLDVLSEKLQNFESHYNKDSHTIEYLENSEIQYSLRLPWQLNTQFEARDVVYVICIIQTESASVGLVKNDEIVLHKTFSTYAVRKKQGKSQIKYLKTRGKSKAGSRLRLANTINFFEHINERLTEYFKDNTVEKIAFSCSKILIPYLYSSKVACPFDKKDERIYKVPKHLSNANFEDLQMVHQLLSKGELIIKEDNKDEAEEMLQEVFAN